jgi:phage-related protein
MAALYFAAPRESAPPLFDFMKNLDGKLRRKLITQFCMLELSPALGEPHVKHFTIAKYARLYELRARSGIMVRIVYTTRSDGGIILLEPFVKRHKRNTAHALESSLRLLGKIDAGECPVRRLGIKEMKEMEELL